MSNKTKQELLDRLRNLGVTDRLEGKLVEVVSDLDRVHPLRAAVDFLFGSDLLDSVDYLYPLLLEHQVVDSNSGQPDITVLVEDTEVQLVSVGTVLQEFRLILEELERFLADNDIKQTDYVNPFDATTSDLLSFVDSSTVLRTKKLTKADLERVVDYYEAVEAEEEAKKHLERLIDMVGTEKAIKALEKVDVDDDVPVK